MWLFLRQHKHDTLVCSRHVQKYVGSAIKAKILKYCSRKQKESKTHQICIKEVGHDKKKVRELFWPWGRFGRDFLFKSHSSTRSKWKYGCRSWFNRNNVGPLNVPNGVIMNLQDWIEKKDLFYCPTKISKILLPKHGLRRRQRGPVFPFDVMATSSEHFDEKMRKLHTHQISRHLALKLVVTQLQEL